MREPEGRTVLESQVLARVSCRVCGGSLCTVLELGTLHLNDFPLSRDLCQTVPAIPHTLTVCIGCGLAQLRHTTPQDWMYRQYYYRSGINEMMVKELRSVVTHARSLVPLAADDLVLDIGANDGTLLAEYALTGYPPRRLAVEPALNLQELLARHAEQIHPGYFPTDAFDAYAGQIKVVTAIAVCYDLEDPLAFFEKIRTLLHPEGVCLVQFQDMGQMLQTAAFDNICPEHLEYYTLGTLRDAAHRVGLEVVSCLTTPINGGSLRVVLRPASRVLYQNETVHAQLQVERALGLCQDTIRSGDLAAYSRFALRVRAAQSQILATLDALRHHGAVIDVYGASTKGNVLLQVLGIGPEDVRQAIDRSPHKEGHYTITGIPIVLEETGQQQPAQAWLVPIWQFRPSVLARNGWFLDQGGEIIFPLPSVEIVRRDWT